MLSNSVLLILLALVVSLGLAAFQYFCNSRFSQKFSLLFTFLRFISYFGLLLLLINPKIVKSDYVIDKPALILAVDNSGSIQNLGASEEVRSFVRSVEQDPEIRERFEVKNYIFGDQLQQKDSFDFSNKQTNIHEALSSLKKIYGNENAPVILITDGNQTYGEDFGFAAANYSSAIFPVVVGDTTALQDLAVSRVNVNKYAYINNKFPVEIFVNYAGDEQVETRLQITSGNSVVFSEEIVLDSEANSQVITTTLPASRQGIFTYKATVLPVEGEQDTLNNQKNFAVEILGERTTILLATSFLHPDLGAIKKSIESNQQRKVEIVRIGEKPVELDEYQLILLYQPDENFSSLLEQIEENKSNYWMITGPETNFRFLNSSESFFQKEITGQTEEFFPRINTNFGIYQIKDIGFSEFPPLKGAFGESFFTVPATPVLYQRIQGIDTEAPLLAITEQENVKRAVLFGANIWKWRAASYVENGSFEEFDEFIGKLIQFLEMRQKKDRLNVEHEAFYYANETVVISAEYFDRNYRFDPRGELLLEITNRETQETRSIPFLLKDNMYKVVLNDLPASEYDFNVRVEGEGFIEQGQFEVVQYEVEQQFSRANLEGMLRISEEHGQGLYLLRDSKKIVNELLSNNNYTPVQKREEKAVSLIEWYYLLGIIIFSLSMEWFLRKYYGYV